MGEVVARAPRRTLFVLVLAAAVGTGIAVWRLQTDASASSSALLPTVKVTRADLTVSVGGVGRIVQADASSQILVPTGSASSGGSSLAPGNAIFPTASGHVSRLLVAVGQRVAAGQPVAVIDDGGAAAAVVEQAQNDLQAAELELRQRVTQDPLRGVPATRPELAAARLAVTSARERLARLLGHPRRADVDAARADVQRTEADLETARGGTKAARAQALRLARDNVQLARARLARLLAPPSPADVSAAEADLKKALADKAALVRLPPAPTPSAIAAAAQAVSTAQQKLDQLTGPPDEVAVSAAVADLKKAYSDLSDVEAAKPPASPQALDAAHGAVDAASEKLAKLTGPPDPVAVAAAQLDLDRAQADYDALNRTPPPPSQEAVDAADQAIDAARQKLAKLQAPPNPADVESARVDLKKAQADVRTLVAGPSPAALAAARKAVVASRARLAQLFAHPPKADVTAARLDVSKAKADLAALLARKAPASKVDVRLAQLKVDAAEERLTRARAAEQLLTVYARSSGTVTSVLTRPGAPVDGSTPVATVADLGHLSVSVDLSEFDVARVRPGLPTRVSVDALGGKIFTGKVLSAALTGVDNGSGVVTFPVEVGLKRVAGVKPGMNVSVRIIVAQRHNVVEVPLEAVSHDDSDQPIVTVIDAHGQTKTRIVKLGLANNKSVQIVKGLRAGERLVLAASQDEG
jgi:RND family efflux transporter MFP subunit